MNRRTYLTAVGAAGIAATAGCSTIGGHQTLTSPSVNEDAPGRKVIIFTAGGREVGHFGVDGRVDASRIELSTEIWHRDGTRVESITLRLWMPEIATESPAKVAVTAPVEGDSSPPPSITLSSPERDVGSVIEITDLDDLADETISTLNLIVIPGANSATDLNIQATIELSSSGLLSREYTLDGVLQVSYPALAT